MLKNTASRFGLVAKTFHWIIALLIIGLIALGWYMVTLTYYDRWYNTSLETHRALGLLVLVLALLNLCWRAYSRPPAFVPTIKPWERISARIAHITLFGMMLVIPATGYIISTSAGGPVSVFGWFEIPAVVAVGERYRDIAIKAHYYLAYGTALLIGVHAAAAFKHQFYDRDGTLKRML